MALSKAVSLRQWLVVALFCCLALVQVQAQAEAPSVDFDAPAVASLESELDALPEESPLESTTETTEATEPAEASAPAETEEPTEVAGDADDLDEQSAVGSDLAPIADDSGAMKISMTGLALVAAPVLLSLLI